MDDLNVKNTEWNLKPLFKGDDDPKIEEEKLRVESASRKFINNWKDREDYLQDPKVLKEALDEYELLMEEFGGSGGKFGYYFWLRSRQDQNNSDIKAKSNKLDDFSTKIQNDMLFFTLKIAKIDENKQKEMLNSNLLSSYKHFLGRLFLKGKYALSDDEEKIMNLKSASSYSNWVKMVSSFLSKEERKVLNEKGKYDLKSFNEISTLLSDSNKKVRDSAAKAFNDILEKWAEVAEAEMNSILGDKKINDELRKRSRPDMGRHISDDIDSKIVDTLIKSVSERFDLAKKYYELKAKLFGVDKLEYHERNVKYGKIDKNYEYNEAINLTYKVFNDLDKEFSSIFKNFIDNGQVDAFPKKGKTSGAFCVRSSKSMPVYILLNYTKTLRDITTIAHEFGHAINAELSKKKQNALNYKAPVSTTEVASTFMEDFVFQELLKNADDEFKLVLLMFKLDQEVSTIFRQVACYNMERDLHESFRKKGYLSKDDIGKIFAKNMGTYMGDFVKQSPGSQNWWVYWSHIRTYFYVYSYASGLLISKALQKKVRKDKKFIIKVKEFLSAGGAESPREVFSKLGIDITSKDFWDEGINEFENLLKEAESLAKKLGKI